MNPIFTALASGYSAIQILNFIKRSVPKLGSQIDKAKKMGYNPDKIVEFLSDTMQTSGDSDYQTSNRITNRKREENKKLTKDLLKQGVNLGATAIGANVLSKMVPNLGRTINARGNVNPPNTPNNPQAPIPPTANPEAAPPGPPNPSPQVAPPQPSPNIGQQVGQQAASPVAQAMQPNQNVAVPPPVNIPQVSIPQNLKTIVDRIRHHGPEQVEGYLLTFHPKDVKQFEKQSGVPIRQSIQEYFKENPVLNQKQENIQPSIDKSNVSEENAKGSEIGSSVLLPDGNIGEIEDVKQGIAKVKVDGKDRHRKIDELIEAPLPEKELSDLYKDVLSGIEKKTGQQVSRNVYWAGYDPNTNELAFIPHHGSLYVYKDISPEDAKELTSFLTQRKTSGENYIGAWEKGSKSPIGASMSALIQRLQKKSGKGKEYSGKYEKIYDALEPAKLASKDKVKPYKETSKKEKEPESKLLEKRFDKIAKKLTDLKNKPNSKNRRLQLEQIKNLEILEKEYNSAWHELREQLIHEKEMENLNEDIRKQKRQT